jgi:hypothetical protein
MPLFLFCADPIATCKTKMKAASQKTYRGVPGRMVIQSVKDKLTAYVNTGIRGSPNRYNQENV